MDGERAEVDALRDWRVARWTATLGFVGLAFDLLSVVGGVHPIHIAAIVITGCTALWSWLYRRPSRRLAIPLIFVVNAAVIAALWVSSQRLAETETHWVPFRPHHLGAFTIALLAPSRAWVGITVIVGFIGSAILQFELFDPVIRARLPYGDPFATIAFGGFAIGVLLYRLRANRVEQEIAMAHARIVVLERFTRTMLAVRDLTNTPLQTLELIADMLRAEAGNPREVADRIERAVTRMKEIENLASAYEGNVTWAPGTESFDPIAVLQSVRPVAR